MKFILFVEGHTEKKALPRFLKKWLDAKLEESVGVKPVRFEGWPELVKSAPKKAQMYLNGPNKDKIIAVISLMDLYGPTNHPSHIESSEERYKWAKNEIEKKVGCKKFHQFFAVHETEAWLLSQPQIFPREIQNAIPPKGAKQHETINFNEPPAKLLNNLYQKKLNRRYKKVVNGREFFSKLDPDMAYEKRPRLKELLDKMLELAQKSLAP